MQLRIMPLKRLKLRKEQEVMMDLKVSRKASGSWRLWRPSWVNR